MTLWGIADASEAVKCTSEERVGEVLQQGVGSGEDGTWEERAVCLVLPDTHKKLKAEKSCVCLCVQANVCACVWVYTYVYEHEGQRSVLGVILKQSLPCVSDRISEPPLLFLDWLAIKLPGSHCLCLPSAKRIALDLRLHVL